MNVIVKSVTSPFSFFCVTDDDNLIAKDKLALESSTADKIDLSDADHGQVKKFKVMNIMKKYKVTNKQ